MNSSKWTGILIGLAILAGHFALIATTWEGVGYVKDAGYYHSSGRDNFGWYQNLAKNVFDGKALESFSDRNIRRYWDNNHQHPPFCKTLMGLHHKLWHNWIPVMNLGNSYRMATWSWAILTILLLFFFAKELAGMGAALFAAMAFILMPRVFFHSHINTFDIPLVAVWLTVMLAFRRGLLSTRWSFATGILLGFGYATRNGAFFLPFMFAFLYFYSPYGKRFYLSVKNIPAALSKLPYWKILLGLAPFLAPPLAYALYKDAFAWTLFISLVVVNIAIAWYWLKPKSPIPLHIAPILPAIFTAPLTFFLLWPWLWHDTWQRLAEFFNRHLNPPAWETYYLGEIVVNPPPFEWHYPFVMSWYTIPAIFVFLGLTGIALLLWRGKIAERLLDSRGYVKGRALIHEDNEDGVSWSKEKGVITRRFDQFLILINILVPFLIIANPRTPIYGGTKHYMSALPFLALAAALSFKYIYIWLGEKIRNKTLSKVAATALGIALLSPGALGIINTHPNCLSFYNEIMGGAIAAPEVGMQRTFWAASARGILDYLNENVPQNGTVWYNNTPWDSTNAYRTDGFLRKDIRRANDKDKADFAVMNHWKYYIDGVYEVRQLYGAKYPVAATVINGMTLTEVYRNEHRLKQKQKPARPVKKQRREREERRGKPVPVK